MQKTCSLAVTLYAKFQPGTIFYSQVINLWKTGFEIEILIDSL